MGQETVMIDWSAVLSRQTLGLSADEVEPVEVQPMVDWAGDSGLDVLVVYRPAITVDTDGIYGPTGDRRDLMRRAWDAVFGAVREQSEAEPRFPYIRFLTHEDWLASLQPADPDEGGE